MAEGGNEHLNTAGIEKTLSLVFESATEHLQAKSGELDSAKLLFFYARYKQAKVGPCNVPKPGFFDFQGKQKWAAWNDLRKMSCETAMEEYVAEIKKLYPEWNPQKQSKTQFGISVSIMACTDKELSHSEKTAFDFVKEDLLNDLKLLFKDDKVDLNQKDEDGLALLHWACDRGHESIAKWLLDMNVDIDILDLNNQTPLHYASSCGHENVVRLLLKNGANIKLPDDEGLFPKDVSASDSIKRVLEEHEN